MVIKKIKEGYQQTELGLIPNDWEATELENHIDLLTGYPFSSSHYSKNGIRLLRGSNIKRGEIDWSENITKYWEKITPNIQKYVLENEGEIVIAMDGSLVGQSFARLSKKDLPALLLQRVARIRSNTINMNYLKEWICSKYFTQYSDSVKTVTAIPHISPKDIKKFTITIPSNKKEQGVIAESLSNTNELIKKLEKIITKKKNIKQGAMQDLLTGKKRLLGFNGKWEVVEIGKHIDLLTGFPFSSNHYSKHGIKLLRGSNIKRGVTDWLEEITKYWKEVTPNLKKYVLEDGDIVVAMDGSLVGASFARLSKKDLPALLLQRIARIRSNYINMDYLKEYVCSNYFSKYCDSVKTVSAIPHISPKDIERFKIPLPPTKEEQSAIAKILSDMDTEIKELETKKEKYTMIKNGMIQKLLTGEIRLK